MYVRMCARMCLYRVFQKKKRLEATLHRVLCWFFFKTSRVFILVYPWYIKAKHLSGNFFNDFNIVVRNLHRKYGKKILHRNIFER
jgi:hypothetical protein